jgi:hypothetical protein
MLCNVKRWRQVVAECHQGWEVTTVLDSEFEIMIDGCPPAQKKEERKEERLNSMQSGLYTTAEGRGPPHDCAPQRGPCRARSAEHRGAGPTPRLNGHSGRLPPLARLKGPKIRVLKTG